MAITLEFQKRPALILAGIIAGLVVVFGFGRESVHFLDRIGTVTERSLPAVEFAAINGEAGTPQGGSLIIGRQELSNAGMDFMAFPLRFAPDETGQLVVSSGGKSFPLGPIDSSNRDSTGVLVYRFAPGPGDKVTLSIERSALSWPTPFRTNFMTGAETASWDRTIYYRLHWKKPSGAELGMVWSYDQEYFPTTGWKEVWTKGGIGGLMQATIRP